MTTALPVEGSIQWAMDRGKLFQVDGAFKYGSLTTRSENHEHAAQSILYRGDSYCAWVAPGTVLTVWNVYAGSIGGFQMRDPQRFIMGHGVVSVLNVDGRREYEADLAQRPTYHDGARRKTWEQLDQLEQWSWNRPACA